MVIDRYKYIYKYNKRLVFNYLLVYFFIIKS